MDNVRNLKEVVEKKKEEIFKEKKLGMIADFVGDIIDMGSNKAVNRSFSSVIDVIKYGVQYIFNVELDITSVPSKRFDGRNEYTVNALGETIMVFDVLEKKIDREKMINDLNLENMPEELKGSLKEVLGELMSKLN